MLTYAACRHGYFSHLAHIDDWWCTRPQPASPLSHLEQHANTASYIEARHREMILATMPAGNTAEIFTAYFRWWLSTMRAVKARSRQSIHARPLLTLCAMICRSPSATSLIYGARRVTARLPWQTRRRSFATAYWWAQAYFYNTTAHDSLCLGLLMPAKYFMGTPMRIPK